MQRPFAMANPVRFPVPSMTATEEDEEAKSPKDPTTIMWDWWAFAKEQRLLTRLFDRKHRRASRYLDKLSHSIDIAYPSPDVLHPIDVYSPSGSNLMDCLRYAMRHALMSLRPSSIAYSTGIWSLMLKSNRRILKTFFNLKNEDIILNTCSNATKPWGLRIHEPGYYLVVDHEAQKIVVSIRSSQCISDMITDLNGNPCPFSVGNIEGKAHEGVLQSAYSIRDSITEILIAACHSYPEYKVLITGHSLGAGTAALLGLMYRDHPVIHKQHGLRVYAFGSPCVVSKEFTDSEIGSDYITSIAVNTDLVTRLSLESVSKYNQRQDLIMEQRKSFIKSVIAEDNQDIVEKDARTEAFLGSIGAVTSQCSENELYPVGRPLWFVPNHVFTTENTVEEIIEAVVTTSIKEAIEEYHSDSGIKSSGHTLCDASSCRYIFQDLVYSNDSLYEHYPDAYLAACGVSFSL